MSTVTSNVSDIADDVLHTKDLLRVLAEVNFIYGEVKRSCIVCNFVINSFVSTFSAVIMIAGSNSNHNHNNSRTTGIIILSTSTKFMGLKIKLSNVNGKDGILCGVQCVLEGDHIPPLESYGQALEQSLGSIPWPRCASFFVADSMSSFSEFDTVGSESCCFE